MINNIERLNYFINFYHMNNKVKTDVIAYIAAYANISVSKITDDQILKEQPLMLDDAKLGFLTLALRDYVKNLNPNETVLISDLRKKGLTVKKTYELIIKKVTG